MGPAIFAGVAGIFAEAALVVLVLDRVNRFQEARDWAFVRDIVGQRMAATMVDVMRLAGIRWSGAALHAERDRHAEFLEVAEVHLADLRSNLEGLAVRAEPADYRAARRVELRLAWLVRNLRTAPDDAIPPGGEWPIVLETSRAISRFLERDGSSASPSPIDLDTVLEARLFISMDAFWVSVQGVVGRS
jgi:hypothetical protein